MEKDKEEQRKHFEYNCTLAKTRTRDQAKAYQHIFFLIGNMFALQSPKSETPRFLN